MITHGRRLPLNTFADATGKDALVVVAVLAKGLHGSRAGRVHCGTHTPHRLQGTQEATAAFVHSADLGLLQQRIGSAGMIRSGKDSGSAYLTGG